MRSKVLVLVGVILIILGTAALVYEGVTYTTKEQVAKVGPLEATAEVEKTLAVPPVVGAVILVGGVLLILIGVRRPYSGQN